MLVSDRAPGCEYRKTQFNVVFSLEVQMQGRLQGGLIQWLSHILSRMSRIFASLYSHPSVGFIVEVVPLRVLGWLPAGAGTTCFLIRSEREKDVAFCSSPRKVGTFFPEASTKLLLRSCWPEPGHMPIPGLMTVSEEPGFCQLA